MQQEFLEQAFTLRTQANYDRDCTDIEEAPTDAVRSDLCTTYGINKRSSLCNLPDFDVTKQLPQDIMHTLLEGTVQYELRFVKLEIITINIYIKTPSNTPSLMSPQGISPSPRE